MEENKEFGQPQEDEQKLSGQEPEPAEASERVEPAEVCEAAESAEVCDPAESAGAPAESVDTREDTTYRGEGAGRREVPFADSPQVMNQIPTGEEAYRPRQEPLPETEQPVRTHGTKKRRGRRLIAWAAVLALVAGSCAVTAHVVNNRWEDRVDALESEFQGKLTALEKVVYDLTPAGTGVSVSGTTAVADGMTAAQVYAENVRSVVLVEATVTTEFYGQTSTGISTGSGFILSEDGYVVTNFHVVEGASSVEVVLYDNTTYPAALVGYDSTNDLAVLKLEADGLKAVTLGSSDRLIVGDQVVAIGNPLGELTATLTVGYVSAKERTINTDGTIINMIQTDAAINSGNSGGPLFNMKGEVVGITTAKYSGASSSGATIEGIGFAIPMDDVREEIGQLIEHGYIKSAYLGVMVQNMDASIADIYGLPVGAYVASVEEGYCAQKAGIQAKDIIIAVGNNKIENLNDLTRALREFEPGDKTRITVYRAGQTLELTVVLDERPADVG